MSQSIKGKHVFPALPRLSSRGSTNTTVARGTALWEILVGKPGILSRPRREWIPPLDLGGGNGAPLDVGGTLVLPLEWRRVCRGTS